MTMGDTHGRRVEDMGAPRLEVGERKAEVGGEPGLAAGRAGLEVDPRTARLRQLSEVREALAVEVIS
jgi:hypothetical protein